MVEFIDDLAAAGAAQSRAEVVARALQRERRRQVAARDAAILAEAGRIVTWMGWLTTPPTLLLDDLD